MSNENRVVDMVYIDISLVDEPEWNPNEQSPDVFNALVKNIKEAGMVEPLLVCPRRDKPGRFYAISGSHRLKAGRVAGTKKVPAIVEDRFDDDMQKFQNMRFNMIKGKLDPVKFTKLFVDMSKKYGDDATRALMAFTDKAAFEQVFLNVRASVPKEIADNLDKAKDEIKTIDGLAAVLNEMFAKYGSTLESGYMVFSYGGQSHLWIIMDEETKALVSAMKRISIDTGKNINEVFRSMLVQQSGATDRKDTGRPDAAGRSGDIVSGGTKAEPVEGKVKTEAAPKVVRK